MEKKKIHLSRAIFTVRFNTVSQL